MPPEPLMTLTNFRTSLAEVAVRVRVPGMETLMGLEGSPMVTVRPLAPPKSPVMELPRVMLWAVVVLDSMVRSKLPV